MSILPWRKKETKKTTEERKGGRRRKDKDRAIEVRHEATTFKSWWML